MKKDKLWTKDFIFVSVNSFFIFMIFYSLMTALPFYVLDDLHQPQESVGLVVSIFLLASVLIRPFAGSWLDSIGRRKILILALTIFLISTGLYLLSNSYEFLLILRFLQGIGFGLATTATGAIAADVVPESKRGQGIGYYGMFMSIAMVIGPYVGLTIIQHFSFTILFISCTVFALISFTLGILGKSDTQKLKSVKQTNAPKASYSLKALFETSAIPIALAGSIFAFSYSSISSYVSLFAAELGLEAIAGVFFIIFGLTIVLSRPFTGKWYDLYGANKVLYPAFILYMVGMILLSFTQNGLFYLVTAAIIGLGYGVIVPSFQTISVQYAPDHRRGAATATYFFFFDSGFGIGAYVNGLIQAKTNFNLMFLIAGIIVIISMIIYYFLHHKKQQHLSEYLSAS
ncbi:MFS transporter [Bacillus massiliigorillae]|uniref:MFS transporter n=1 Tax=Bacillus massiliigorillae TaxID=1243664 RepID=UPI0003A2B891|nr:MFS transporter [Bacillus massiliigorillae]